MSDGQLADLFLRLGIALGLGLLVGLQRQRAHADDVAGFRTFALVSLTGAVCGRLSLGLGGWVLAAGLLALGLLLVIAYHAKVLAGRADFGLTTEVAALLMYAVGAFAALGSPVVAVAIGGATAALLQWKESLHGLAQRIGDDDVRAAMQFVVISMVVLPVLPDRAYGPYHVLNPHQIWWMVVLIVGLSLAGYVGYKLLGERAGTLVAGIVGGLVSSTATTVTFARRARRREVEVALAASVMVVASAILHLRVLVVMGVVWAPLLRPALAPMLIMVFLQGLAAAMLARWRGGGRHETAPHDNPSELPTALLFAVIFAAVLLASAWAKAELGAGGLYGVAAISGLVDLDAITLSSAQLARIGRALPDLVWRVVMLASLSNLVFKAAVAGVMGGRDLLRRVAPWWGLTLLAGIALLLLWPGPAALVSLQ